MGALSADRLLTQIFARDSAIGVLWNLYAVVSLGVLGFVAKSGSGSGGLRFSRFATAGFGLFALSNLAPMVQGRVERDALLSIFTELDLPESYEQVIEAMSIFKIWQFVVFHLCISLTVIILILWFGKRGN